jgi:hypothetical protein
MSRRHIVDTMQWCPQKADTDTPNAFAPPNPKRCIQRSPNEN